MQVSGQAVGLLLDTGHAYAAGFDYALLIKEFGSRINHIHLKDVRRAVLSDVRERDRSFNEAVRGGMFTVPGDGDVDFSALTTFLSHGQYEGWLVVEAEQDPSKAPPLPTVTRAKNFVVSRMLSRD